MRDSVEFLRSKATEYAGEYNPEPSKIFKAAAKEIARLRRRLAEVRLTDAEREAVGVAIQCVEAARAQRHPEEEEARDLLWKTTCGLRSLLDRTDRT